MILFASPIAIASQNATLADSHYSLQKPDFALSMLAVQNEDLVGSQKK